MPRIRRSSDARRPTLARDACRPFPGCSGKAGGLRSLHECNIPAFPAAARRLSGQGAAQQRRSEKGVSSLGSPTG